jgi:signal peptidase I
MRRWTSRVVRVLLFTLFGGVLFLFGAFIALPKIMGWMPLAVLTGSMRPHLPPGTELVVQPLTTRGQIDELKVGDVVTYMPRVQDSDVITHRIIAISPGMDGHRYFTFQGDANPAPDPGRITEEQIRAKLLYSVPLLGYLTTKLPLDQKSWGLDAIAIGLFGYAGWQLLSSVLALRRSRRRRLAAVVAASRHFDSWVLPEDLPAKT